MKPEPRAYTVDVWVDGKTYRTFSIFDSILRVNKWVRPAVFAGIFCVCATVCFALSNPVNQGRLLGIVLLVIGLGMPLVYFGTYLSTLYRKIEKLQINKKKRHAYTITLCEGSKGVAFLTAKGVATRRAWGDFYMAYRRRNAIYLYPEKTRAYILPKEQTDGRFEEIWTLICDSLPAQRRWTV